MLTRNSNIFLSAVGLFLCSGLLANASTDCDPKTCTGPSYYYEELGCVPIYENSSSCCPIRYNCDHWNNLPDSKCFLNGHAYESGEVLPIGEMGDGCTRCICNGGYSLPSCVSSSCAGSKAGCYLKQTPFTCCSRIEVCPEKEEDIPTCVVNGKTYKDGERFAPLAEPEKICYCGEGYTGENIEPFCISYKPGWCGNSMFAVENIRQNCAPVYADNKSPRNHCNNGFRCYKADTDFVQGHPEDETTPGPSDPEDSEKMCKYGNLKIRIGESLSVVNDVKCTCEVPPVLTCQKLPPM